MCCHLSSQHANGAYLKTIQLSSSNITLRRVATGIEKKNILICGSLSLHQTTYLCSQSAVNDNHDLDDDGYEHYSLMDGVVSPC